MDSKEEQPGSLSQKVIKGGFWIFGLRISRRVLDLVRTVILARLLAPHDFGLMGIALLTLQTLEAFSQTGFQSALVQKKGDISKYLNVAWTVLVLRGIALSALIFFSAPYIANFFNTPESKSLIQVVGLSFLLQGFTNISVVLFQKELDFKRQYWFEASGFIFDFLVSIVLVFVLKSVWALVIGKVVGETARLIASYTLDKYRPSFNFHFQLAKKLHEFGRWVSGVNIVTFIVTQGDSILVGKLFGPTSLGIYKLASTVANLPTTEITHMVSQVTFPAYVKFQDTQDRLRDAFKKTFYFTIFLSSFLSIFIFNFIPDFTRFFLGSKWLPIITITQVLVFAGFIRSIASSTGPLFQAIGRPELDAFAQFVRLLVFLIVVFPLSVKFGLMGTAVSVLLSIFAMSVYTFNKFAKVLQLRFSILLNLIFPYLLISGFILIFHSTACNYLKISSLSYLVLLFLLESAFFVIIIIIFDNFPSRNYLIPVIKGLLFKKDRARKYE